MSIFYVKDNAETTRQLFEKRLYYRQKMAQKAQGNANIVDFNLGEKMFYGKTDRDFIPIIYTPVYTPLAALRPAPKNPSQSPRALSFVADIFNEMMVQYNKALTVGKLSSEGPQLSALQVTKAFENPQRLYQAHYLEFLKVLQEKFAETPSYKFVDFDEFISFAFPHLLEACKTIPFTRPAFMKSKYCPISCSGLAIELADAEYRNDEVKWRDFVDSPNWGYFVNVCDTYGFMIDAFIPWRIVADIDSSIMAEYAAEYGLVSTDDILDKSYMPAHMEYITDLRYILLHFYNTLKSHSINRMRHCRGRAYSEILHPTNYTKKSFDRMYDEKYFLNLYFKLRFQEEESVFEDSERKKLTADCYEVYEMEGVDATLNVFERILNKPFDYRGSIGYIKKHLEALDEKRAL